MYTEFTKKKVFELLTLAEACSASRRLLLREGLTHIHIQKKPRLHFGESFALATKQSVLPGGNETWKRDLSSVSFISPRQL